MAQLPTDRTTADDAAEHVDDHNTLHGQHNDLDGHAAATAGAHPATAVSFSPSGLIVATDVQAALAELDAEKATVDHAHSGTYEPVIESLWVPAATFGSVVGAPTLGSQQQVSVWLLDADISQEAVSALVSVPPGWTTYDAFLWWSNAGAGSGGVHWRLYHQLSIGGGTTVALGANITHNTATTAPAQNVVSITQVAAGFAAPSSGEMAGWRVGRLGSQAGDTLGNDAAFLGLRLVKAS